MWISPRARHRVRTDGMSNRTIWGNILLTLPIHAAMACSGGVITIETGVSLLVHPAQAFETLSFFTVDTPMGSRSLAAFRLEHHWQSGLIGTVMTLGGLAGMLIIAPASVLISGSTNKQLYGVIPGVCTGLIFMSRELRLAASSQVTSAIACNVLWINIAGVVKPACVVQSVGISRRSSAAGDMIL